MNRGRQRPATDAPMLPRRHRPDVQGLRAVAVLLVAFGHAGVGFTEGGYVGVDVFFVLSGFLITGLLLHGAVQHRRVSLTEFYVRRARRILPSATLTLVATAIVADQVLNVVRAKTAVWDTIWASLFVSNVHYANQATDYFAREDPPSPVQHFWSLSVEEQFYLVWPGVLSLVLFGALMFRRSGLRFRAVTARAVWRLFAVIVLIATASMVWSIVDTYANRNSAYFSTLNRIWELGLGSALAIGGVVLLRLGPAVRTLMGWIGLGAIAAAGVLFSATTAFPGYTALLPTVGAALVIAAGLGNEQPRWGVGRLLAIAPMRYVGDRSYTFYLWHWPVLVLAEQHEGRALSLPTNLVLLAAAFALSVVTYKFFEDPIRRMRSDSAVPALMWPASALTVLVIAGSVVHSINSDVGRLDAAAARATTALATTPGTPTGRDRPRPPATGASLPDVLAAVRAAKRGDPVPPGIVARVPSLTTDRYVLPAGCVPDDGETSTQICELGDTSARRSVVLMGDSHAQMWGPPLLRLAEDEAWTVRPLVKSGCTPDTWESADASQECRGWFDWALGQIATIRPDATIITGAFSGAEGPRADAILDAMGTALVSAGKGSGTTIVLGDTPRLRRQPVDCLLENGATLATCAAPWETPQQAVSVALASLTESQDAVYVDDLGWFCADELCPAVVGDLIAYFDTGHLTRSYAEALSDPFAAAFRRAIIRAD